MFRTCLAHGAAGVTATRQSALRLPNMERGYFKGTWLASCPHQSGNSRPRLSAHRGCAGEPVTRQAGVLCMVIVSLGGTLLAEHRCYVPHGRGLPDFVPHASELPSSLAHTRAVHLPPAPLIY